MRAALIENGRVANIIEVASLGVLPGLVDGTGANMDDLWDGVQFSSAPVAPSVPTQVTSRQGGLALLAHGHYQPLLDAVDALPEPQRTAAKIEIGAPFWERSSQAVATFGPLLGLTEAQIDDLFIEAATL